MTAKIAKMAKMATKMAVKILLSHLVAPDYRRILILVSISRFMVSG
jgi:hypothetical protein